MSDFIKVELTEEQYDTISRIGITKLEVASIGCKMTIGGGSSDFEMTLMDKDRFNQPSSDSEALDMIDTTSRQVESLANDSESPIWENGTACFHDSIYGFAVLLPEGLFFKPKDMNKLFSVKPSELSKAEPESKKHDRAVGGPIKLSLPEWGGEGLPPVGIECCFTPDNNLWGFASTDTYFGEVLRYEGEQFIFLLSHDKYNMRPCHLIVSRTDKGEFSKPESPEQRARRERLEAIKEMAQTPKPCGFAIYDICEQLYDAGYRKESK